MKLSVKLLGSIIKDNYVVEETRHRSVHQLDNYFYKNILKNNINGVIFQLRISSKVKALRGAYKQYRKADFSMNMRLVRFTKGLLDIMFYVGMAITAAIPVIFHYVGMYIEKFRTYYVVQCALYMASGVLALLLVLELRRMFATVLADDAFVMENAASLKRMGKCSFLIAVLSVLRLFVAFTPATAVIIIVFSIAGLFCFVLCLVFEQAIRYKQENDLTI